MTTVNAVIVLQARMASSRLRGKALCDLNGRTLIAHCFERLRAAGAGEVVLATTTNVEDDELAAEADRYGVPVFRGASDDVLGRFAGAAAWAGAEYVVRATGDNPAVDPGSASRLLDALRRRSADYAVEDGLPYGCTVEALTARALAAAAARARDPHDREHVTPFIRRPGQGFRSVIATPPGRLCRPDLRFTVDTPSDLAYMRAVFSRAEPGHPRPVGLAELIATADARARREVA